MTTLLCIPCGNECSQLPGSWWGKVGQMTKSPFASPRRTKKAIDMEIKGKKLTFHPPDSYNDDAVNTDPPQQRLKLEWA